MSQYEFDFSYQRDQVREHPEWVWSHLYTMFEKDNPNSFYGIIQKPTVYIIEDYCRAELAIPTRHPNSFPSLQILSDPNAVDYWDSKDLLYRIAPWKQFPGDYLSLYLFLIDEGFLRPGYDQPLNR